MKEIVLTNKMICLVDDEDFITLNHYKWRLNNSGYVSRNNNNKILFMHRFLMSPNSKMTIDHINCNKLDNRKENLRICTQCNNSMNRRLDKRNTSGYKGVYWDADRNNWVAQIGDKTTKCGVIYLGSFKEKDDAARAYNRKAIELYGNFAKLNIIQET